MFSLIILPAKPGVMDVEVSYFIVIIIISLLKLFYGQYYKL